MKNSDCPESMISMFSTEEGINLKTVLQNHQLVYILTGSVRSTYGYFENKKIKKGQFIFLPVGEYVNYQMDKATTALYFQMKDLKAIPWCCCEKQHAAKSSVLQDENKTADTYSILQANKIIEMFMEDLARNIAEGLNEEEYYELKINELLYLFGVSYPKKQLEAFFSTSIYIGNSFSSYILRNNHIYNSVAEISSAMSYTISGFEKKFKKAFGVPPAKWMREQKAKRIYQEVCYGKYDFKEIADRYNFSSTSTFHDFFKFTFGETPGNIRKKFKERRN